MPWPQSAVQGTRALTRLQEATRQHNHDQTGPTSSEPKHVQTGPHTAQAQAGASSSGFSIEYLRLMWYELDGRLHKQPEDSAQLGSRTSHTVLNSDICCCLRPQILIVSTGSALLQPRF